MMRVENGTGSLSRWNEEVGQSDGGRGGGDSHAGSPSFLVLI